MGYALRTVSSTAMTWMQRLTTTANRGYFELSYRSLTGSPEGRRFLGITEPIPGTPAHGYTTAEDLDALDRHLDLDAGDHVLDLGCGLGGIAMTLGLRTGAAVTGIDLAERAVRSATELAAGRGLHPRVSFVQGSLRRVSHRGADGAYAFDSLMFVPLDASVLLGIRDALVAPGRLVATVLAGGARPVDPVRTLAQALGVHVVESADVTVALIERSMWRRRAARHVLRTSEPTFRGRLAMTLVVAEESAVQWLVRAGRLRRWRTVVDLHVSGESDPA